MTKSASLLLAVVSLLVFSKSTEAGVEVDKAAFCEMSSSEEHNATRIFSKVLCIDDTYFSASTLEQIAKRGVHLIFFGEQKYYSASTLGTVARAGKATLIENEGYYSGSTLTNFASAGGHVITFEELKYYSGSTLISTAQSGRLSLVLGGDYYSNSTINSLMSAKAQIANRWSTRLIFGGGFHCPTN